VRSTNLVRLLARSDQGEVAAKLTLLLMVLYGLTVWQLEIPTIVLAAMGLAFPGLIRRRLFWGVLTILQAVVVLPLCYTVDNHKLLLFYWTVALAVSLGSEEVLALNARLLIGLCFGLAAFWKLYTGEYVNGAFLHYTLLVDGRFSYFANVVAGVPVGTASENSQLVAAVANGLLDKAVLSDAPNIRPVAMALSYWTIAIECLVSVSFMLAERVAILGQVRNAALLLFVASTYSVATVIGFAWLLLIMGFAQTKSDRPNQKLLYLGVFLLMQMFRMPWSDLLSGMALT